VKENDSPDEKIADGLAGQGFAVVDNFLTGPETDAILDLEQFKTGLQHFKKAGIGQGKNIHTAVRGDYIQWIDRSTAAEPLTVYLNRLSGLIKYLREALFLSLKDYEVHLTIYPAGSSYKRHLDQFRGDDHRRLSVVCYLNKDWDAHQGGQLKLYLPEGSTEILPIAGRLVCFRSDQLEHEVLPATRERLSLTGWILDQCADLKQL
jgi:SM-20-related protein